MIPYAAWFSGTRTGMIRNRPYCSFRELDNQTSNFRYSQASKASDIGLDCATLGTPSKLGSRS